MAVLNARVSRRGFISIGATALALASVVSYPSVAGASAAPPNLPARPHRTLLGVL